MHAPLIEQKCLRALNGACTKAVSVEAARLRAEIIPAVCLSYFGTPAGTVGGDDIPFERLFQDNPWSFGLPTFTFVQPCCVSRTKSSAYRLELTARVAFAKADAARRGHCKKCRTRAWQCMLQCRNKRRMTLTLCIPPRKSPDRGNLALCMVLNGSNKVDL